MTKEELLQMTDSERNALPRFKYEPVDSYNCYDCTDSYNCYDCTECTNCTYCANCTRCRDCTYCANCTRCRDCTDCTDCTYCRNCIGIINGKDLRYVAYGVQLTEEEWKRLSLLQ
jgi:hypothetical protein